MEILIDTSILIEKLERQKDIEFFENNIIFISILSVFEYLIPKQQKEKEKEILEKLANVLDINNDIVLLASKIKDKLLKIGKPVSDLDYFIAATALAYDLELWTLDKDFLKIKEEFPELKLKILD